MLNIIKLQASFLTQSKATRLCSQYFVSNSRDKQMVRQELLCIIPL